jgi:hypothetical protein
MPSCHCDPRLTCNCPGLQLQKSDEPVGTLELTKSFGWDTLDAFMQVRVYCPCVTRLPFAMAKAVVCLQVADCFFIVYCVLEEVVNCHGRKDAGMCSFNGQKKIE